MMKDTEIVAAIATRLESEMEDATIGERLKVYVAERDGKRCDKRDTDRIKAVFPDPMYAHVHDGYSHREVMVLRDKRGTQRDEVGFKLCEGLKNHRFDLAWFLYENRYRLAAGERNAQRVALLQAPVTLNLLAFAGTNAVVALALISKITKNPLIENDGTSHAVKSVLQTIMKDAIGSLALW